MTLRKLEQITEPAERGCAVDIVIARRCVAIAPVGPGGGNERSAAVRQDDEHEQHAASLDAADHRQRLAFEGVAPPDNGHLGRNISVMGSVSPSSFDSIDWELMLKAVRRHTDCPWVLLYVERWLKASVQMEDGSIVPRTAGTPQGGVISPLLANLFLHYAFDMWMAREFPHIPFERYADDAICHCRSAEEAQVLWSALGDRLAACKLVLHPVKTKIVYCKDVNRRGDFPVISFDFLGFQFRARKTMWRKGEKRIFTHSFQPAASPKALTRISREVRSWTLHKRSDKSLIELAGMYNPCIRGWIAYYSQFYKTQLRPTLKRIDAYVIRWARRKFKRMVHQTKGARDWFDRLRRATPTLFAHWPLCHGNGRTSGAV